MDMRLIDADKLLEYRTDRGMINVRLIYSAPTVEAEPIKYGKWIKVKEYSVEEHNVYKCSECGELYDWFDIPTHKYCRHCGAKIDEVTK